ncbi:MAG: BON domain-containing protein [Pirellulales bacterium]
MPTLAHAPKFVPAAAAPDSTPVEPHAAGFHAAHIPFAGFPVVHTGVGSIPAAPNCPVHVRVQKALAGQTFVPGDTLRFEIGAGRVTLHGRVRSYFHKQMAQETLRGVEGVLEIDNRMIVEWPE